MEDYEQYLDNVTHKLEEALKEYIAAYQVPVADPKLNVNEIKSKSFDFIHYLCDLKQIKNNYERKIINAEILNYESISEFDSDFIKIQSDQIDFDPEKGFLTTEYIFQRISDKKYFKLEYTNLGRGVNDLGENDMKEVFLTDLKIKKVFK